MIWVPIVSILIFSLIFMTSIIIGLKTGWKAALFISIIILLFTLLWLVLGIAIYNYGLWTLYKNIIVSPSIKSTIEFNLDNLSSYYKPSILIVFIGMLSPISLLSAWGIYSQCKRPLNKYLGHKVQTISSNEKNIILKKNRKPSKIIGGVVLGGTSLFIGSLMASSTNVFLIPYNKKNFMTKINDELANIYTFGQAKNSEDTQVIQKFLSTIDKEMIDKISQLINFESLETDTQNNTLPNANDLLYVAENKIIFKELFKFRASEAIFKSIFLSSSFYNQKIELWSLDDDIQTQYLDANKNQIGLNISNNKHDINTYLNFLNNNPLKINNFPQTIKKLIEETIFNKISKFENSSFKKELDDVKSLLAEKQKLIKARNNNKDTIISEANNISNEINDLIASNEKLSGFKKSMILNTYDITDSQIRSNYQKVIIGNGKLIIDPGQSLTSGAIFNKIQEITNLIKIRDDNEVQKTKSFNIWNNYHNNDFTNAEHNLNKSKIDYENKKDDYDESTQKIETIEENISSNKKNKEDAKAQISYNDSSIIENQTKFDNLNTENNKLTSEKSILENELDKLNNEYDIENNKIQNKNNEKSKLKTEISSKDKEIQDAQDLLNSIDKSLNQTSWNSQNNKLNNLKNEKNKMEEDLKSISNEITKLSSQLANIQKGIDDTEINVSNKNTQILNNTYEIQQIKNKIKDLKQNTIDNINDISHYNSLILKLTSDKTNEKNLNQSFLKQLSSAKKTMDDIQNKFNPIEAKDKKQRKKYDDDNDIWNSSVSDVNNAIQERKDMIEEFNENIQEIENKKNSLLDYEDNYDVLVKQDTKVDTTSKLGDIAFRDFGQTQEAKTIDDNSIYWSEKYVEFLKNKKNQIESIYDSVSEKNNNLVEQFKNAVKNWIGV